VTGPCRVADRPPLDWPI